MASLNPLPEITFLAVAPHVWGRGKTPDAAIRNMKNQGYTKGDPIVLHISNDPGIHIDDMGYLTRKQGTDSRKIWKGTRWNYGNVTIDATGKEEG